MFEDLRLKLRNLSLEISLSDQDLSSAFIHRSYLNEVRDKKLQSNERLEFLGDSVLSLAVSRYLFDTYTDLPEGKLTSYRSSIVKTTTLAVVAQELGLGSYLQMSKGELDGGGRENPSLLADTFEAFLGVMYLKQGFDVCERFIRTVLLNKLEEIVAKGAHRDAKSIFQEKVQELYKISPQYRVVASRGPDHAKEFDVEVSVGEKAYGLGTGKSKQEAEQRAAQVALDAILSA
jgi:ribonuclease-3